MQLTKNTHNTLTVKNNARRPVKNLILISLVLGHGLGTQILGLGLESHVLGLGLGLVTQVLGPWSWPWDPGPWPWDPGPWPCPWP